MNSSWVLRTNVSLWHFTVVWVTIFCLKVSRILLSILADIHNALEWIVSILHLIFNYLSIFQNHKRTTTNTIGITVILILYSFFLRGTSKSSFLTWNVIIHSTSSFLTWNVKIRSTCSFLTWNVQIHKTSSFLTQNVKIHKTSSFSMRTSKSTRQFFFLWQGPSKSSKVPFF